MSNQEQFIRDNIAWIGAEAFPDTDGVDWKIHTLRPIDGGYEVVVSTEPNALGYERVKLNVAFHGDENPDVVGAHVYEDGRWNLLFGGGSSSTMPNVSCKSSFPVGKAFVILALLGVGIYFLLTSL